MRQAQQMVRTFARNPRIFIPALAVLVLLLLIVPVFASGLLTNGRHASIPGSGGSSALVSATGTASGGYSTTQPGQVTVSPTGSRSATPTSQPVPATVPSGSTPTAGSGQTPTASPTAPCCSGGSTPSPTAISAPLPDDAAIISIPTGLQYVSNSVYLPMVVLQNTGTSTWTYGAYNFVCKTNCYQSVDANMTSVAPGTQISISFYLYTQPTNFWRTVVTSDWIMEHNGVPFGPVVPITYTLRGWYSILQQPTPGCGSPAGASWNWWQGSSANTIACSGSGLEMGQSAAASPRVTLASAPVAYNQDDVQYRVHVHFDDPNSQAYATFVVRAPVDASQCGGDVFELRPTGEVRWTFQRSDCSYGTNVLTHSFSPAQDYDVLVQGQHYGTDCIALDGGIGWCPAGSGTPGVSGLAVVDPAASGAKVYYSNYSLDQFGW